MTGNCIPGPPSYSTIVYESWNLNIASLDQRGAREKGPGRHGRRTWRGQKNPPYQKLPMPEQRERRLIDASFVKPPALGGGVIAPQESPMGPRPYRTPWNLERRQCARAVSPNLTEPTLKISIENFNRHVSIGLSVGKVQKQKQKKENTPRNSTRTQRRPSTGTLEG